MDPVERIATLAGELRDTIDRIDELERQISENKKRREQLEMHELPGLMENAEIQNIKFQGIGTLYLDRRVRVSCLSENKPLLLEWLKGHGHQDLIKEDVPWNTLSAWGKELLEENQPLPEMCQVFTAPTAKLRRK